MTTELAVIKRWLYALEMETTERKLLKKGQIGAHFPNRLNGEINKKVMLKKNEFDKT